MRLSKRGRKIRDKLLSLYILVNICKYYEYAVIFFFHFVSILYSVGFVCLGFVCFGNQSLRVARLVTSKVSIGIRFEFDFICCANGHNTDDHTRRSRSEDRLSGSVVIERNSLWLLNRVNSAKLVF
nr:MAG: hypothetical protein [Apis mellifera filamentous virus]WOK43552.1 MAG: hypothetical protein [Apis mellifera filamentous virus]